MIICSLPSLLAGESWREVLCEVEKRRELSYGRKCTWRVGLCEEKYFYFFFSHTTSLTSSFVRNTSIDYMETEYVEVI